MQVAMNYVKDAAYHMERALQRMTGAVAIPPMPTPQEIGLYVEQLLAQAEMIETIT